ncbi:winged helix-turn-helix domain-containing protein [Mycoplasma bradburyae]|uniref:Winged helix-turn-helix domain-containing protein n=1 Tax=Mycoplasma bradburyae TaxID=2963128 RepID=A0AAW6HQ28_9MOLU|nr:winged helix-turn-helix domain-containing protein [Mycoplasma bradburyae]MDC4183736.1 winged helix-turn-helix domain-containing protein [Mycoplasma bradburyae]UTS70787.1 winged helix-turn-helix domain-containing protein [Mycoplasma bradburyae]
MQITKSDKKTQQIVEYLFDLIDSGKVPVNKILPSEHQLMNKFNCSRNIVVAAYQKLSALGAVYSIRKRGRFVAENFHNLIKPLRLLWNVEKVEGEEVLVNKPDTELKLPEWAMKKHIIFIDGFRQFNKRYYINDKLMGESEIFVSLKNVSEHETINPSVPMIDILNERRTLTNVVYELEFDDVTKFGCKPALAVKFFGYDNDSICVAGKYYIDPKHFKFNHQEFSLF